MTTSNDVAYLVARSDRSATCARRKSFDRSKTAVNQTNVNIALACLNTNTKRQGTHRAEDEHVAFIDRDCNWT